jgi:hypothetical protein
MVKLKSSAVNAEKLQKPLGVWLGVVVVRLGPILGVETQFNLEPTIEERHDRHHSCVDGLRRETFVLQFVLVVQNILAAVFVGELFSGESDEIAEVLALGLHGPSGPAGEFQVSEVGLNFVLNDFQSAELNDARSFGGRGNRTLASKPLVLNLIESQLTPALRTSQWFGLQLFSCLKSSSSIVKSVRSESCGGSLTFRIAM